MKTNKGATIRNPQGSYPLTFDGMDDVGDLYCGIPYIRGNGIAPARTNQMKQVFAGLNSSYKQLVCVGKGSLDLSLTNVTETLINLPYREYIPTGGGVIDYVSSRVMSLVNSGTATYYLSSNGRYIIRQYYDNTASYVRLFNGTSGVGSVKFKYLDITVWQYSSSFYVRGFGINSSGTLEAIQFTASVGNSPNVSTGGSIPIYTYKTM